MASDTDADLKTLKHEVAHLRADLAHIAETLKNLASHGPANAADHMQASAEKLQDAFKDKMAGLTHEIEEKPVAAAMTSFVVGIVLGALFGGRR